MDMADTQGSTHAKAAVAFCLETTGLNVTTEELNALATLYVSRRRAIDALYRVNMEDEGEPQLTFALAPAPPFIRARDERNVRKRHFRY